MNLGALWLLFRWMRSRRPTSTPLPIVPNAVGDLVVPVVATFSRLRGAAWLAFAHNNTDTGLTITPLGLICKVVRRTRRDWDSIAEVDVRFFGSTVNLIFAFEGSATTFTANTGSGILATTVLHLLPDRVPLSDRARALRSRPTNLVSLRLPQ